MNLLFNGKPIDNTTTLKEAGVKAGDSVHMVILLRWVYFMNININKYIYY